MKDPITPAAQAWFEWDTIRGLQVALGMITPLGNVVVEQATQSIGMVSRNSAHLTRVAVTGSFDRYSHDYHWEAATSPTTP